MLVPFLISSLRFAGSASRTRNGQEAVCILVEHHEARKLQAFFEGQACGLLFNQKTYVNN